MDDPGPTEPNPFEGFPFLADLARLFSSQGPVSWQVAGQVANWLATQGESEPNVDPLERIRLEELLRVADLHVSEASGLDTSAGGGVLSVVAVTRSEWSRRSLEA